VIRFNDIPIHGNLRVSKSVLPKLSKSFQEIPDYMGDKRDAIRQYRGPCNIHVLEYSDYWSFHRDYADPRYDIIGHLALDAPEIPAAVIVGAAVASDANDKGHPPLESLGKGLLAGLFTWALVKGANDLCIAIRESRGGKEKMTEYEFTQDEVVRAWNAARGYCECCGKALSLASRGRYGKGSWEAHHGSRSIPVILCTGEPENCHFNCGHDGDYCSAGITPRVHKGGGYVR
jgi:hypothetical protein